VLRLKAAAGSLGVEDLTQIDGLLVTTADSAGTPATR
jgi:hypothetical protein